MNFKNLFFDHDMNGIKLIIYILGLNVRNKSIEDKSISLEYNRLLLFHKSMCEIEKVNCPMCKKTEILDIIDFIEIFYKYLKIKIKNSPRAYVQQKKELILIKLVKYLI